jgi:uncharacterized membrane protein YbhN (UPF0104 family)
VLRAEGRLSLWTLARIDLTTLGVSHVVPGGAATASALRYRLLTGAGVNPSDTISGEAVQVIGSAVVLNVMLWISLLISLPTHGGNAIYVTVVAVGTLLIAGVFAVIVLVTRGSTATMRAVRMLTRRVPLVSPDQVERLIGTLAERLRALGADRPLLARAILWAATNWMLDAASLWVFLAAFGHQTTIDGLAVAYGLANVLADKTMVRAKIVIPLGLVQFEFENLADIFRRRRDPILIVSRFCDLALDTGSTTQTIEPIMYPADGGRPQQWRPEPGRRFGEC